MSGLTVEEYPHAYLVRGTASLMKARRVLAKRKLQKAGALALAMAGQFPARPTYMDGPVVAFYFNVGGERVTKEEKRAALNGFYERAQEKAA